MTKTDFDSKYSPIAMPEPFAGSGSKTLPANTQDDESGFSFPLGFSDAYSSPSSNNGKFVTRAQMNEIGNLATHNDFYRRCGGINTFDPAFADAIGGYPKGAILQYLRDGNLFYVVSNYDNNKYNFVENGVDSVYWSYCYTAEGGPQNEFLFADVKIANQYSPEATQELLFKKAARGGVLSIYDLVYTSNEQPCNIPYSDDKDSMFGAFILCKASSDPTDFTPPTPGNANGYSSLYTILPGANGAVGGGSYTVPPASGNPPNAAIMQSTANPTWIATPSPLVISKDDYISIFLVAGSISENRAYRWDEYVDNWVLSYINRRGIGITGLSFKVKLI